MPYDIDTEPIVITVPAQATAPVNDIPAAEWVDIKNRVAAVEGLGLVDLSDIDLTDLDDGMLLSWNEGSEMWVPVVAPTGALDRVAQNYGGSPGADNVVLLTFGQGLSVINPSTGRAHIAPVFGNAANTVAEGNHSHIQPAPSRWSAPPSGYMGGGSRAIGSTAPASISLTAGIPYVLEAEVYGQFRGADPGAAYYTLSINIGGDVRSSPGGTDGFWCVQGVPDKIHWEHSRRLTGAGTGVSVSASVAFHSGAGFNVDRTYLKVRLRPDR